jgi:hypothetical protein
LSKLVALVVALLALVYAASAHAHASRTAYLELIETGEGEAVASLRADPQARLRLSSDDCTFAAIDAASASSQAVSTTRLRCARGVEGSSLSVDGELGAGDVVVARFVPRHGDAYGAVLTARSPRLVIPVGDGSSAVLARYVRLGVEHVLSGLDHVLFLLALVWQSHAASRGALRPWLSELARAATGFTLAHTVTLTATALGWIHVPPAFAETMIAVSLVLVALDVGRTSRLRVGVVSAFGLVHGLGFASALAGGGLPRHAVALGLVAFNVGVEIGQIALLAGAAAAIALLPRLVSSRHEARHSLRAFGRTASAYAVGAIGAYLFFDRTSALFHR